MGMYDVVDLEMDCPECGNKYLEFQTKDSHCVLDRVKPEEVKSFYTVCDCGAWISFSRLEEEVEELFPDSRIVRTSWKFGKYLYSCSLRRTIEYRPELIKERRPAMIRKLELLVEDHKKEE